MAVRCEWLLQRVVVEVNVKAHDAGGYGQRGGQ